MSDHDSDHDETEGGARPDPLSSTATVELDANAPLRNPLAVLCILVPLGLVAELYRFLSQQKASLLTEEQWSRLGAMVGIDAPLVPILILVVGCLVAHLVGRHPLRLPTATTVLLIALWAAVWATVRYGIGFTAEQVTGGVPFSDDPVDRLTTLGQLGLAFSGALQEELVFRGAVLGMLLLVLRGLGAGTTLRATIALLLSAAAFSLAHTELVNHYGAAEPFGWPAFMHRFAAGLLYGWIFIRQGLAVVTLAHAGYNAALILGG